MKINPKIIIRNLDGKKYYEIKYYDTDLKDTVIGYGSYNRKYVEDWLQKDFDPVRLEQEQDFEAMVKGGTVIMRDFIMNGLTEMRSNVKYSKADVMYLALHFLKERLIDEDDVAVINDWYKEISLE